MFVVYRTSRTSEEINS